MNLYRIENTALRRLSMVVFILPLMALAAVLWVVDGIREDGPHTAGIWKKCWAAR